MTANISKYATRAGVFVAVLSALFCVPSVGAQSSTTAVDALQKARVLERLADAMPAERKGIAPGFVLDPAWPQPLPHHWVIGDVGGIAVDKHDHIWVYQRPRSVSATDSGLQGAAGVDALGKPVSALGAPRPYGPGPIAGCCAPAPSVLVFDKAGKLLQAWGGPGDPGFLENKCRQQDGCVWPAREHGIFVDQNDYVYIGGNGRDFHGQFPWASNAGSDSQILKFKSDGTFIYQIGTAGAKAPNSNDTNGGVNGTPEPYLPADMVVDPKTNFMFVADGYGNRRVLIVDAATGKYVGHFGAYGQNPVTGENGAKGEGLWGDDYKAGNLKPKFFRSALHCAKLANDGLLYVCDRNNDRVQIFKASEVGNPCTNPDGEVGKCGFIGELLVAPQTVAMGGTAGTVNFSTDPEQTCMYVADISNDTIYVINRQNLTELARFGTGGRQAGEFHAPHVVATDSDGNLYVGEVDGAARIQKFLRFGATGCSGTGDRKVGKYQQ